MFPSALWLIHKSICFFYNYLKNFLKLSRYRNIFKECSNSPSEEFLYSATVYLWLTYTRNYLRITKFFPDHCKFGYRYWHYMRNITIFFFSTTTLIKRNFLFSIQDKVILEINKFASDLATQTIVQSQLMAIGKSDFKKNAFHWVINKRRIGKL